MLCLKLQYEYGWPKKVVYDWWTDLSGTGYVGEALKSLRPIGKDGEKIVVETKWRIMMMNMILREKLTLDPPDHWIWEPHMLGIDIVDDFRLQEIEGGKVALIISSHMTPSSFKGKFMNFAMGWLLRKIMINEWDCADKAFRREVSNA